MKSIREILSNNNCDKKEVVVMLALHYRSNPNLLIELTSVAIDHSETPESKERALANLHDFTMRKIQEKSGDMYSLNEELCQSYWSILHDQQLSLFNKRVLRTSLQQIMSSKQFKPNLISTFFYLIPSLAEDASYVVIKALLKSTMSSLIKLDIMTARQHVLVEIARKMLSDFINRYHQCKQLDRTISASKIDSMYVLMFLFRLKDINFVAQVWTDYFTFLLNLHHNQQSVRKRQLQQTLVTVFFDNDLSEYFTAIMKLQQLLQLSSCASYNLHLICTAMDGKQQNRQMNILKGRCLKIYCTILRYTDREFNLVHTTKSFMRNLPDLVQAVLNDLYICSNSAVYKQLNNEADIYLVLGAMFNLLTICSEYSQLQTVFRTFTITQLVQLTFGYLVTQQYELGMFQDCKEEFMILTEYICSNEVFKSVQHEQLFGSACVKKDLAGFVNCMARLDGFTSVFMELCFDIIMMVLNSHKKISYNHLNNLQAKYSFNNNLGVILSLDSAFQGLCIIHEAIYARKASLTSRLQQLFNEMQISMLSQLQLARVYLFLSHCPYFFLRAQFMQGNYHWVQHVFKIPNRKDTLKQCAYDFLKSLIHLLEDSDSHYVGFIDRLVLGLLEQFESDHNWQGYPLMISILEDKVFIAVIVNGVWVDMVFGKIVSKFVNEHRSHSQKVPALGCMLQLVKKLLYLMDKLAAGKEHCQASELEHFKEIARLLFEDVVIERSIQLLADQLDTDDEVYLKNYCEVIGFILNSSVHYVTMEMQQLMASFVFSNLRVYSFLNANTQRVQFDCVLCLASRIDLESHGSVINLLNWLEDSIRNGQQNINEVCLVLQAIFCRRAQQKGQAKLFVTSRDKFMNLAVQVSRILISSLLEKSEMEQQYSERNGLIDIPTYAPLTLLRMFNTYLYSSYSTTLEMVVLEMESLVIEGITIFDLNVLLMNVDNIIELGVHEESLSRLFTFAVRCLNNFCSNSSSTFNKDILRLMDKTKESKCWLAQFDPYKAFRQIMRKNYNKQVELDENPKPFFNITQTVLADSALSDTVQKLLAIRSVDCKPRMIFKIARR